MAPEDEAASFIIRKVIIPSITGLISLTIGIIKEIASLIYNKSKILSNGITHEEHITDVWENKNINNNLETEIKQKSEFNPYLLKKGEEFEDYVKTLFNEYFEIMPRNESYPDYKIKFNPTREIFVIECKWRKRLSENSYIIDDRQFKNYKDYQYQKNIPFFMVLGLGGYPLDPYKIFIIPRDKIDHSEIQYEYLALFEKNNPNKPFNFNPATKKLS